MHGLGEEDLVHESFNKTVVVLLFASSKGPPRNHRTRVAASLSRQFPSVLNSPKSTAALLAEFSQGEVREDLHLGYLYAFLLGGYRDSTGREAFFVDVFVVSAVNLNVFQPEGLRWHSFAFLLGNVTPVPFSHFMHPSM